MSNIPIENREIIYKNFNSPGTSNAKHLRLIHFNDVYNIEGVKDEPVGGAARFKTVLNEIMKDKQSIVIFSGDAVSPSMLSLFAKGKQMIEVMNTFGIDAAGLGI
jgi:5'-nucleotidase